MRAWLDGDVPYYATGNYPAARRAAALLVEQVAHLEAEGRLGRDEVVHVLEVGAGLGRFASRFLRALDDGLGDAGRRLASRLRYVYSDCSLPTARQATAGPELAPHVASGRVIPAFYCCHRPRELRDLDGEPLAQRAIFVVASYVCCVLRTTWLRHADGCWLELMVPDGTDDASWQEQEWAPIVSGGPLGGAPHAAILAGWLGEHGGAPFAYPSGFIDFLDGVQPLLHDGALILVDDFGSVGPRRAHDDRVPPPRRYGASLNHGVEFAIFDAFAAATGAEVMRTAQPFDATHHVLVALDGVLGSPVARAFTALYLERSAPQDLLDHAAVGRKLMGEGDFARALRYFDRALALDPYHPELHLDAGLAALAVGLPDVALEYFIAGRQLDAWRVHDFDTYAEKARAVLDTKKGSDT